jgi:hypothetical protein
VHHSRSTEAVTAAAVPPIQHHHHEVKAGVELTVTNRQIHFGGQHLPHHQVKLVFPAYGQLQVTVTGDGPIPTYEASPHPLDHVEFTLSRRPPGQAHHHAHHEKPIKLSTDGNGSALFADLEPGEYALAVDLDTGELGLTPHDTSAHAMAAQGIAAEELIRAVKSYCSAIYLWGMTDAFQDGHPDRNNPYAFDARLRPKPAYVGMLDGAG